MNIKFSTGKIESVNKNLVVLYFKDENFKTDFEDINAMYLQMTDKSSKIESSKVFINNNLVNLCTVNLGKREDIDQEKIRVIGGNIARKFKEVIKKEETEVSIDVISTDLNGEYIEALAEGIMLGSYEFDKYKEVKCEGKNVSVNICTGEDVDFEKSNNMATSILIARKLVNEPANVIYPETLANEVVSLGKEYGFEVEVYEEDKINELGMEAFMAVGKGSINKPRFIVMRYLGDKSSDEILGLVGKGLTYDSGGYSIKPTNSMMDMKSDMAGAASVIGTMCLVAKDKINKNVIAVVAACENTISMCSYKPGDIIGSMGKKTIEIVNTDAEGRLTLADAVYYIVNNEKVTKVVDIATLTGAAVVALGSVATPIVTNNDDFYSELESAAKISGEKIWRMPVFEEYKKDLKGVEADLKNSGARGAGCIVAGLFIGEFVGETPWIHMDIAGTSMINKPTGYKSKGATGEGVRTLYNLAK
ncbi:MAG: leucyl aminopeptidase [Romboutsia sp.]